MLSINFGKAHEQCHTYCNGGIIDRVALKGMITWVERRVRKYFSDNILNENPQENRAALFTLRDLLTTDEIKNILCCLPENLLAKSAEYQIYNEIRNV